MLPFLLRRILLAAALVLVVSSTALLSVRLAPGDVTGFNVDPAVVAAERHRAGLDRPMAAQYVDWLGRALRLDFGESLKYRRPVTQLVRERAGNTFVLGFSALLLATVIGIPLGVITGSRPHSGIAAVVEIASVLLLSVPPLVTSFALLLFALMTGWFPVGGFAVDSGSAGWLASITTHVRYLVLPIVALALPIAASLERLQSRAMRDALGEPSVLAARARGLSRHQVIWRHGFRLSLKPVLAIYGVIVGSILSGSFVVEIVMSWPGLGALMYEGLVARDLYLVAGCAAVGSLFLAAGVLASDLLLAVVDPRLEVAGVSPGSGFVAGAVLVGVMLVAAVAATAVATNDPARQFPDFPFAPPMRPHVVDASGALRAPFVYPLRLEDRLERRYAEDRSRPLTLRWFSGGLASADGAPWFPLGTDALGRDVFARLVGGARLSLGVAIAACLCALAIGAAVGGLAGLAGGLVDDGLMRVSEVVMGLPVIYAALTLRAALPLVLTDAQVFWTMTGVFGLIGWPLAARGVRAIVAVERGKEYAEAARSAGSGRTRLLLRHLMPATWGFLGVQATLLLPAFIIAEATLSFVGLGFPGPAPSWGVMLQDAGAGRALVDAPWLLSPALAIALTVLGTNLIARSAERRVPITAHI